METNNKYEFEEVPFGINEKGIHLLRKRYNYKSIPLENISSIRIFKGKESKHWYFLLFLGIAATLGTLYYAVSLWEHIASSATKVVSIESITVILFPLILGIYLIYLSFKTSVVMVVKHSKGEKRLPLEKTVKTQQTTAFKSYLKTIISEEKLHFEKD